MTAEWGYRYQGSGRPLVFASEAMCATSHPAGAMAAHKILAAGGNAVDAAVAGAVALGLCEPMMCGLGGDAFALIHFPEADRPMVALNGSGRAPAGLDAAELRKSGLETVGPDSVHAVTLPGAVDAFDRLVSGWGKLDLAEVLQPAIAMAEAGVPVSGRTHLDWQSYASRLKGAARDHYLPNGNVPAAGDLFTSRSQASALRLIAREGRQAFYEGEIMEDMISSLRAAGGVHTAEDFAATQSEVMTPVTAAYRDHLLTELPPNTQGPTALLIARILERFDLAALHPHGAERIHLEAEASRLAYASRDEMLADADFDSGSLAQLSDAAVDVLASKIDPRRAKPASAPRQEAVHRDTVYICVVDKDRLAVSLIYSTFWPFGSGYASEKFGISFQNRGAGFSLRPGHPNELAGGKRPLHTLIPGMLEKPGAFIMPFGVMGGPYQATGHAHLVSNIVDFGMDVQAAIDAPRSFADPATGKLTIEATFADSVADELVGMGHDVERTELGMGGAQAIQIEFARDLLIGGSDTRKDGLALGV